MTTWPTLAIGRFLRTLAVQLHQVDTSAEYKRGYLDALGAIGMLCGVNDSSLHRATIAREKLPAGYELETRP